MTPTAALRLAIERFGHVRCLAHSLNVRPVEAEKWKVLPHEHAARCAELTAIPADVLCPGSAVTARETRGDA